MFARHARSGARYPAVMASLRVVPALLGALVLAACDPAPVEGRGAIARFAPAGAPLDFADVPFPSDLYLDASGRLALGEVPSSRSDEPFFDDLRALLRARDGFSSTGAVHFGVDGLLDPASLPASAARGDVASTSDGVLLLDADPASGARGSLVPLRVFYDERRGLLTARPARGYTLGPGRRWVAALTTALRAADGTPLGPSAAFAGIRDGSDRSQPAIDEALTALEAAGVARADVAVATIFTTERPGADLVALRAALHATPAPTLVIDRVIPGPEGDLDDFFGVPAEDRPGVDVAAASGAADERAMQHTTVARVVLGRFTAPRFLSGAGTDVGTPRRDASGALEAGPAEDVPFVLAIPTGADLASLPVLVVHHGFNASRVTALVLADTAGRAGMAVLGIDAFQHGARALDPVDELHNLRGTPGADGLSETSLAVVSARTFGIVGPPSGMELFPTYPEGAFLQFAADAMSAVRMLRESDPAPLRALDASLATLSFDGERIAYLGISMGSVIGASMLAAEPDLRALVLAVPPGSVTDTLCEGAGFRSLATSTLAGLLGIRGPFDEVSRSCAQDPIVDLFRWAMEPIDPLALAPHFFREPLVAGPRPDVLWLAANHDELAAPPATESMLAVAGAPGVGEFAFATIEPATLPAQANLATPAGPVTAVAVRCAPCSHGLPEVLGGTSGYQDPMDPPLLRRDADLSFENPIVLTHARITRFLEGVVAGERATVE